MYSVLSAGFFQVTKEREKEISDDEAEEEEKEEKKEEESEEKKVCACVCVCARGGHDMGAKKNLSVPTQSHLVTLLCS